MRTRGFKRFAAAAMATTMVFGSAITAFADNPTPGVSEGTGTYEGGEMQYPTLAVTLPTIPDKTYDYIADPNGLIAMTDAAHYADSEFDGSTGVFFLTTPKTGENGSKNRYTNKSAAQTLTNQNAQDIDVTVKLEQKTAGSEGVVYSNAATFESTDTATKIYLAVTDDAEADAKTSALSATAAATLTATVAGKPENYKPNYDSANGYGYVLKTKTENDNEDLKWNSCSFTLTGALNKNATWGDSVTFPAIKVTWSYAEHQDTPAVVAPSTTTTTYDKTHNGSGVNVVFNPGTYTEGITAVKWSAENSDSAEWKTYGGPDEYYTISTNTLSVKSKIFNSSATRYWRVYFADDVYVTLKFTMD